MCSALDFVNTYAFANGVKFGILNIPSLKKFNRKIYCRDDHSIYPLPSQASHNTPDLQGFFINPKSCKKCLHLVHVTPTFAKSYTPLQLPLTAPFHGKHRITFSVFLN